MEGQANEQPIEERMLGFLKESSGDIVKLDEETPLTEPQPVLDPEPVSEEQPAEDSEVQEEPQEEGVRYKFTIKTEEGEQEVEMTPEEMQKSVMLERDYRRKTTELARQREQLQEEIRKNLELERMQYLQNLEVVQKAFLETVVPEFDQLNMAKLAEEDPAQYVRVTNRVNQVQQRLKAIQDEQARVMAQSQAEQKKALEESIVKARETLTKAIPSWSDQLYEDTLKTTMNAYGFKPEEVNSVIDPRIVQLMYDASQYQKLKGQSPLIQKKVAQAPKVLKPSSAPEKVDPTLQARASLKKSGKTEDFAAFLMAKMNKGK